jgi:hypothetical protein
MHKPRTAASVVVLAAFAAAGLAAGRAEAKPGRYKEPTTIISIPRLLLPDVIADRIEGSGIEGRSLASKGGALYSVDIASAQLNLTENLALRGGVGMARFAALPLDPEQSGIALSVGVTYSLWRRVGYSVDVDLAGLRACASDASIMDGGVMMVFRRR